MTVRILVGDVGERLADLPDNSVHMVCTSPPYFGLRSYGTPPQVWGGDADCAHDWAITPVKGELRGGNWAQGTNGRGEVQPGGYQAKQVKVYESIDTGWCQRCGAWLGHLGLEPTLALFIEHLVDVFRKVRRVLRPDGTCWLNIGDSYAGGGRGGHGDGLNGSPPQGFGNSYPKSTIPCGLKPKDLMMIPARLAIALCDDGWTLRSDIIWHKRAPMPESVTDRPTSAHEHIFLLTKQPKYFYDSVAVAEDSTGVNGGGFSKSYAEAQPAHGAMALARPADNGTRNLRNVWTLSPEPFPSAHFATFPSELPRRCIKAGTSERGCCSACGAPWRRQISVRYEKNRPSAGNDPRSRNEDRLADSRELFGSNGWQGNNLRRESETTGWEPSCACDADVVPCLVLDPFFGSGTTGLVSDELGRDCIGIELSREYSEMARSRIYGAAPMFAAVEVA